MSSASAVLIRFGEVFLKKGRRRYFMDKLSGSLERRLGRLRSDLKVVRPYGRFLVVPREDGAQIEDAERVVEAMAGTFGIVWAGPCDIVKDRTDDSIREAVVAYALRNRRRRHKTFKIATKRADKRFPFTSIQCNQRYGGAIYDAFDGDVDVDVHEPDLTINLEIRDEMAFIYGAGIDGVGGLPTDSNGRALLLLSGGIDSPVAGYLTQKRGVGIDAINFMSPPYTGPQALAKVEVLANKLSVQQKYLKIWLVELTAIQEMYRDEAPAEQLVLLYRRSMFRIADELAARKRHGALVTGENLGQVASQTVPNLHVIGSVATRPVLRPLVTYDKREIVALAKKIDTYETSILPYEDCCSLFVPKHPELKGKISVLERLEEELDPLPLEARALEQAVLLEFPGKASGRGPGKG